MAQLKAWLEHNLTVKGVFGKKKSATKEVCGACWVGIEWDW